MWTVGSTYGVIEIDKQRELQLGVQTSFYVAVALTYLDFLMEREVSIRLDDADESAAHSCCRATLRQPQIEAYTSDDVYGSSV